MRAKRLGGPLIALALLAGCGTSPSPQTRTLRLGYFPNLTHATALVGIQRGFFAKALGSGVKLETKTFNAGPAAVEALFSDAVDATYAGPSPAVNAFVRSSGAAVRIISGSASGGAFLVVKPGITAETLKGKKIATPQLGNSQDVALRTWLESKGYATDAKGGGVGIMPQDNAQTLETFRAGQIDGAWVPEPWATRMLVEARGAVLVDERTLWPEGRYATTVLLVRTAYLREHASIVRKLLHAQVDANDFVRAHPEDSQRDAIEGITAVTGKGLDANVVAKAWPNLTFTVDPIASSLRTMASAAAALGFLDKPDLTGIYDLALLNSVLRERGQPTVKA